MKGIVFFAASAAALCASATITVATNGTAVTVSVSANPSSVETLSVPFLSPDVSSVVFSITNGLYYYPASGSTYSGGTDVERGQLYIMRSDALGTGPIRIGASGFDSSLLARGASVVLTNKVVFGPKECYAVGMNNDSLTLKSIGVVESGSTKRIRLGRTSAGGASSVCLSLTDPESEAIEYLYLSGALALTLDGGVIKARADASSPFVKMATADEPDITVTTNGITFNVAAGADLRLGAPLKFQSVPDYTVLETYSPQNNDFETGSLSPWSIAALSGYSETGGVVSNDSGFDTQGGVSWHTPDGSKYLMLRHHAVLSTTINVPTTGDWRLRLLVGCRPKQGNTYYSEGVRTDVKIGDEVVFSFPALASSEIHPFEERYTAPFALTGGVDYTLSLVNATGSANYHMNFDRIVLERVSTAYESGTFSKAGSGALSLENQSFDGVDTSVSGGTLDLFDCQFADMELSVAGTAVLHRAEIASDAVVSVASGGMLSLLCTGTNILVNSGFEANKEGFTARNPTGWTISVDPEYANANNTSSGKPNSGVQMNGNTVSASGPHTPYGVVTAFLRENTKLSQSFGIAEAGSYRISYVQACRSYYTGYKMPIYVEIDGEAVLAVPAHDGNYGYERHDVDVELAAGSHVLTFRSGRSPSGYQGEMVFVDDVSLRKIDSYPDIQGEFRMASGSTLELDSVADFTIPNLYVGNAKISGGKGALARAGVTVVGSKSLRVGDVLGLQVIFR